jgi:hypothetical protein
MRPGGRRRRLHEAVRPSSVNRPSGRRLGEEYGDSRSVHRDRSCRLDETESLPYEMFSASAIHELLYESLTLHEVQVR